MKLIIGLGNPGEKYIQSRHNLGFMVLDELARKVLSLSKTKWVENKKFNSQFIKINPQLILVKPQTMMNASGFAVAKLASFYKIKSRDIWIIHDDVDLLLGKIKIRLGGAAAGHHGVESVIQQLGTDEFVRFRLGIGKPSRRENKLVEDYVLHSFDNHEVGKLKTTIKKAVKAIKVTLDGNLEKAMNQFNQ